MKKSFTKLVILSILALWNVMTAASQDLNYTQYFNAPLNYNPAATGLTTGLKGRFLFRDQWPQLPVDFKSYYFSADLGDRSLPGAGGLGLVLVSDNPGYGMIKTMTMGLTVAIRIPLTAYLTSQVGFKVGFVQKQLTWNDFVFTDQLDRRLGAIYQTNFTAPDGNKRTAADFGAGGILQFSGKDENVSGDFGLAVDHLFQPDISFLLTDNSYIPRKWVVNGDLIINTQLKDPSPLKINIGFLYQNQAKMNAFQVGVNLVKYNIYLGGWFKSAISGLAPNNVLALNAGYRYAFTDDLSVKFIYSYDIQMSGSLQGTGGAHEISLLIDVGNISLFGGSSGKQGYITPMNGSHSGRPLECSEF